MRKFFLKIAARLTLVMMKQFIDKDDALLRLYYEASWRYILWDVEKLQFLLAVFDYWKRKKRIEKMHMEYLLDGAK